MADSITVKTIPYGPVGSNMYILEYDGRYAIVDPSVAPSNVDLSFIHSTDAVFITHGHFDHVFFGVKWQDILGDNVPFYISDADMPCLTDEELNVSDVFTFEGTDFPIKAVSADRISERLFFNDKVRVSVLETPGHSRGSVCYIFEVLESGEKIMFSGDMLFAGSIGRYDMPGSDYSSMRSSLELIKSLDGDMVIYPGHGGDTTLSSEKRSNPFFS